MSHFIESSAGRLAAGIQTIGASFDPEVLSLPGGSIIAVGLWLYTRTMLTLHRGAPHEHPSIAPIPTAACAGCLGRH
jgi:predicted NBD/HSP70 family sugar kinase